MLPPDFKIIDISLELDPKNFAMRTPAGFKKDMQFAMEVIKEHDAPGGAGQIVRGGTQIHELPLVLFIGDAIIVDLRDKLPGQAITEDDLQKRAGTVKRGDRLMLRTDLNNSYNGGSEKWMKVSPYLTIGATMWCIDKGGRDRRLRFLSRQRRAQRAARVPQFAHAERTRRDHDAVPEEPRSNRQRSIHADRPAAQTDRRGSVADPRRRAGLEHDPENPSPIDCRCAVRALDGSGTSGRTISRAPDHAGGAADTGHHNRHPRPALCRQARQAVGPANRGDEPAGRRRHRRRGIDIDGDLARLAPLVNGIAEKQ
jgi:hypothetical protein